MKTIIAGSRSITDYSLVVRAVEESGFEITEVVSGCAHGVDTLGEQWADENGIPKKRMKANWRPNGVLDKWAGHKRNAQMGDYAQALVAVTNGSGGTANMIEYAKKKGLKVFVLYVGSKSQRSAAPAGNRMRP